MLVRILSLVVLSFAPALAAPAIRSSGLGQTVTLDNGTFTGISDGKMVKFYGLPYAKPPYVALHDTFLMRNSLD